MRDNRTRKRIEWIASAVHPKRMIASPTLAALRALLSGLRSDPVVLDPRIPPPSPGHGPPPGLSVRLDDMPGLGEVGGVAMVATGGGDAVGVARVGRTSFVGFKLDGDALREIEVELDEPTGRLRIASAVDYPGPVPS